MTMHYCKLSDDCYHCQIPFCPYEKLEDRMEAGWEDYPEEEYDDDDEDEGW